MKKLLIVTGLVLMLTSAVYASGTAANTTIEALGSNIVVSFTGGSTAGGVTQNWSGSVLAIHGLLENNITGGTNRTDVAVGADQTFAFEYRNRSNQAVVVRMDSTLTQAAARWSMTDDATKNIAEDALETFTAIVNADTPEALELVTLDVTTLIESAANMPLNVVSYNAFANAVGDMQNGAYGGLGTFSHQYTLQAQGYDRISVVSRAAAIDGAQGTAVIPGAKILYTITVRNDSSSVATDISIADVIPNSCHLYFNDAPAVIGEVGDTWTTAGFAPQANTTAAGATVTFSGLDIPANSTITLSYTVTID